MKRFRLFRFFVTILVVLGLFFLAIVVWLVFSFNSPNYAEKSWEAVDKQLVSQGVTKVCAYGDKGKGIDNFQPWYTVYYQFNTDRDQAYALINKMARAQGFNLMPASPIARKKNRYDAGIEAWNNNVQNIFVSSKMSDVPEFKGHPVRLRVNFVEDSEKISRLWCNTKEDLRIFSDETHTGVFIETKLPDRKDL